MDGNDRDDAATASNGSAPSSSTKAPRARPTVSVPRARLLPKLFPFSRASGAATTQKIHEISIYYGSMFGNAERHARALAHEVMTQRRLRVFVHDLDAFEEKALTDARHLTPTHLYVFVVSTHFAGSPSPSAERFHKWIERLEAGAVDGTSALSAPQESASSSHWLHRFRLQRRSHRPSFLRRSEHPLKGMQYTVFGIGDSAYLTYNAMGKFVDHKLKRLGATRFLPLGLGDCSNGLHSTFKAWEDSLLQKLPRRKSTSVMEGVNFVSSLSTITTSRLVSMKALSVVPQNTLKKLRSAGSKKGQIKSLTGSTTSLTTQQEHDNIGEGEAVPPPSTLSQLTIRDNFGRAVRLHFRCRVFDLEDECAAVSEAAPPTPVTRPLGLRTPRVALFDDKPFADIIPVESIGISSSHSGPASKERVSGVFRVRLLDPETTYTTVSTLAIFPRNSPELVVEIAEAFGFDLDAVIELTIEESENCERKGTRIQAQRQQLPFPTPCTVRTALTEFLELQTVTRDFIRIASGFVVTSEELQLLESLAAADGSSVFRKQFVAQHKGILELVAMAPTLVLPLEVFLNITPTMKPRYYTIASSPAVSPTEVDIAVGLGNPNQPLGVAASFFTRILASRSAIPVPIRAFISVSRFQFQDDGVSPMIFIATGVGFTAMRALIQERLAKWYQNARSSPTMPKHLLFLGATNEDALVFSKDLRFWEQQMVVKAQFAFSCDQRYARRYVQDVVQSHIDEVFETVTSSYGSRVFVCGRTAMVRRVREIFEADQMRRRSRWYDTLHASGRFIEEGYE